MASSAKQLLEQVRAGDPAALGRLLEQQQGRLYRVCLRMVSNRDDAAEVTQEAMLRIVQHIGEYRGEAQLTTWMIRIAMNQSITHLRRRRIRQTTSLDAPPGSYGGGGENASGGGDTSGGGDQASALRNCLADSREPDPAQRVQTREQVHLLEQAIASLSDEYRSVLVLRDIDGMDYQQIADTLEMKVGTVKSRLFRARLALRETLIKADPSAD